MKRSKMIGMMAAQIINVNNPPNFFTDRESAKDLAERLLNMQEKLGMLPPSSEFGKNYDKSNDYTPVQQLDWEEE